MAKYLELVIARDGGMNEELSLLLACLALSSSQQKKVTHVLKNHSIYESYQDYIKDEALE